MKLSPIERLVLLNGFFPESGSVIAHRLTQLFLENISLTAKEIADWGVEDAEGGRVKFAQPYRGQDVEFEIDPIVWNRIASVLREKDAAESVTVTQLSLYEKFVESNGKPNELKQEIKA